jgi:hypothetical protein
MTRTRTWVRTLFAGMAAGALVLGVGGRLAMAGLAIATRQRPRFSLGGSLEVVMLGTLLGVLGGLLLIPMRARWATHDWLRGALLGAALCGMAWLSSPVGRQTAQGAPLGVAVVVALSLVLFILYGVIADRLSAAWTRAG